MTTLISEVGSPLTFREEGTLIDILKKVPQDTIWGIGIARSFADGKDTRELIKVLASQCMDDPFTMACVVGMTGLKYLLRVCQPDLSLDEMIEQVKKLP